MHHGGAANNAYGTQGVPQTAQACFVIACQWMLTVLSVCCRNCFTLPARVPRLGPRLARFVTSLYRRRLAELPTTWNCVVPKIHVSS